MRNYFPPSETECRCGCGSDITDSHRALLNGIRGDVGEPLHINSGCRCDEYDAEIGGKGVHPTGNASDIRCSGKLAHKVLESAMRRGVKGIGISQKGPHQYRFIHIDTTDGATRPWVWSY